MSERKFDPEVMKEIERDDNKRRAYKRRKRVADDAGPSYPKGKYKESGANMNKEDAEDKDTTTAASSSSYRDRAAERRAQGGEEDRITAGASEYIHIKKGLDLEAVKKRREEIEQETFEKGGPGVEPPTIAAREIFQLLMKRGKVARKGSGKKMCLDVFVYDFTHPLPRMKPREVKQSEKCSMVRIKALNRAFAKQLSSYKEQQRKHQQVDKKRNTEEEDDDDIFDDVGSEYVVDVEKIMRKKEEEEELVGPQKPDLQSQHQAYPEPPSSPVPQ